MGLRKSKTLSAAKKTADKWFSIFIRLRDSNSTGLGRCVTCDKAIEWKQAHCGHFQSRRYMGTRYDEQNTALQCAGCNTYNAGEQFRFSQVIDEKYGDGTALMLEQKARSVTKLSKVEVMELAQTYKDKAEQLAKEKRIKL